jgi:hypothetical protein
VIFVIVDRFVQVQAVVDDDFLLDVVSEKRVGERVKRNKQQNHDREARQQFEKQRSAVVKAQFVP